jgi:hypothetical protein
MDAHLTDIGDVQGHRQSVISMIRVASRPGVLRQQRNRARVRLGKMPSAIEGFVDAAAELAVAVGDAVAP